MSAEKETLCPCFPGNCRGGEIIDGFTVAGQGCKVHQAEVTARAKVTRFAEAPMHAFVDDVKVESPAPRDVPVFVVKAPAPVHIPTATVNQVINKRRFESAMRGYKESQPQDYELLRRVKYKFTRVDHVHESLWAFILADLWNMKHGKTISMDFPQL